MISILTFSIVVLVAINFLLLKFSCNKTASIKKEIKRPIYCQTKGLCLHLMETGDHFLIQHAFCYQLN